MNKYIISCIMFKFNPVNKIEVMIFLTSLKNLFDPILSTKEKCIIMHYLPPRALKVTMLRVNIRLRAKWTPP